MIILGLELDTLAMMPFIPDDKRYNPSAPAPCVRRGRFGGPSHAAQPGGEGSGQALQRLLMSSVTAARDSESSTAPSQLTTSALTWTARRP